MTLGPSLSHSQQQQVHYGRLPWQLQVVAFALLMRK